MVQQHFFNSFSKTDPSCPALSCINGAVHCLDCWSRAMAQGPPISSRQGPGLQQWLSKYGLVGTLASGALGIETSKKYS